METKQLTVTELKNTPNDVRKFMFDLFDFLINNYKIQSMSAWERDHTVSDVEWKEKINELVRLKNDLTNDLKNGNLDADEIFLRLGIEIGTGNKARSMSNEHIKVSA